MYIYIMYIYIHSNHHFFTSHNIYRMFEAFLPQTSPPATRWTSPSEWSDVPPAGDGIFDARFDGRCGNVSDGMGQKPTQRKPKMDQGGWDMLGRSCH